ncbi:MAG: hypothetical protein GY846_07490 [Deltaproteobacteria bacterium]|nr:hypothetical protein [Deltaproteobacteria bacterium]
MPESPELGNTDKGCYTDHGVSGYGVAVRLTSKQPMPEKQVKEMAEGMMMSIAEKCMDLGAKAIGHIKSHIRTDCGTIKADTIGTAHGSYSDGKLDHPVKDLYVAINSIIQGIPEHAVKAATLEGIHEIADQYHIFVVKEKEHTYFDEFDFLMSKEEHQQQLEDQFKAGEEDE